MSEQTVKYLLQLNWGYRFGLWTYHLQIKKNQLEITKAKWWIHIWWSTLVTFGFVVAHVIIILFLLTYELFKSYRHLPETIILISISLLFGCYVVLHLFTLFKPDFFPTMMRNTSMLRQIYGKLIFFKSKCLIRFTVAYVDE